MRIFLAGLLVGAILLGGAIAQQGLIMQGTRDYASYTVTITRVDTTATAVSTIANQFITGDSVTIAGADQAAYNGTVTVTVTNSTTFTYAVAGSPATPATGTITAVNATPGRVSVALDSNGYLQVVGR